MFIRGVKNAKSCILVALFCKSWQRGASGPHQQLPPPSHLGCCACAQRRLPSVRQRFPSPIILSVWCQRSKLLKVVLSTRYLSSFNRSSGRVLFIACCNFGACVLCTLQPSWYRHGPKNARWNTNPQGPLPISEVSAWTWSFFNACIEYSQKEWWFFLQRDFESQVCPLVWKQVLKHTVCRGCLAEIRGH